MVAARRLEEAVVCRRRHGLTMGSSRRGGRGGSGGDVSLALLAFVSTLALSGGLVSAEKYSSKECRKLGFTKALQCKSCDILKEEIGVGAESLGEDIVDKFVSECVSCCSESVSAAVEKFAEARLEVCD